MTWRRALVAAAVLMIGSAALARPGRIYDYLRTNHDGSDPEAVHVFHRDAGHLVVMKEKSRCTSAALVTADIDPASGEARRLVGGRLGRDGQQIPFATLDFDAETRMLAVRADLPEGPQTLSTRVADRPWHLYDFDLASLTIASEARLAPEAPFSFGLPLLLVGDAGPVLADLGRADAVFVRRETHRGRAALRFDVGGPALEGRGGPLWLDAADGHVLGARWGIPNHAEYRDFALELTLVEDSGEKGWRSRLDAHWRGCPAR